MGPYCWILKVSDLFKIPHVLINFLRINISMRETALNLIHQNGNLKSKPIILNSGIFQGVSLSPVLFFCQSLTPLSKELNYKFKQELNIH